MIVTELPLPPDLVEILKHLLPEKCTRTKQYLRQPVDYASFILFKLHSGSTWRGLKDILPAGMEAPPWNTLAYYHSRWREFGIWQQVEKAVDDFPDNR
jgi:transposase